MFHLDTLLANTVVAADWSLNMAYTVPVGLSGTEKDPADHTATVQSVQSVVASGRSVVASVQSVVAYRVYTVVWDCTTLWLQDHPVASL